MILDLPKFPGNRSVYIFRSFWFRIYKRTIDFSVFYFWIYKWRKSAHFLATRALPQDTAEQVAPGRVKDTGPRTVGAVTQQRFDESDAFEDERQKMATDTRTFRLFANPAAPPVTSAT